jgi:NAD(P)H-dependent flavin oxidoreductase YrpB (nitropropane dioxygenase family)
MLHTILVELLGIEFPIIQAPIGSAASPQLAAAVSNAGGLGMLALAWKDLQAVRRAIRDTRELTSRPFGVNFVLEWDQRQRFDICLEEKVPVISFSWGDPSPYLPAARRAGVKTMQTVASAAEAGSAAGLGIDILVAQGWEAGGHVLGQVATMALVPAVVDAVSPTPVVAAGGIADGRGLAAVLALGADGAWIGTRFLASEEAFVHNKYREAVLRARETDTVHTSLFDGGWPNAPHRAIQNSTVENWRSAGSPCAGQRPSEGAVVAQFADGRPVHLYDDTIPLPGMTGEVEKLALYAGQSVGLVNEVKPADAIVQEIVQDAARTLRRIAALP